MKKLFAILVMIPNLAYAGTANISSVKGGTIVKPIHMNQFFDALTVDLVPRNSSGVPTLFGGNMGLSTKRFDNLFSKRILFGISGSEHVLDSNGVNPDDLLYPIPRTVFPSSLGQISSSSTGTNLLVLSTTFVDVTNLTATITTHGYPVSVFMQPEAGTAAVSNLTVGQQNIDGVDDQRGFYRILRDGSEIMQMQIGKDNSAAGMSFPANVVEMIDYPSAGSHTYKVQAHSPTADSVEQRFSRIILMVHEEI